MRYPRAANLFWEMPAGASTVLHQFFFPMMYPYVLQVGHGTCDFSALRHRMDKVIQHSHVAEFEQTWNLATHRLDLSIPFKRYSITPAREHPRAKISMPAPFEVGIKPAQL